MKKQIVTFTMSERQSQFEVNRLEEEAIKAGIPVKKALYRDLTFDLKNGASKVLAGGEEINGDNTLGVWFRVAGTKSGKYIEGRNLLIRLLQDKVFCVNGGSYLDWSRMGKIAQHGVFVINSIPVVPTRIFYTKDQILNPSPAAAGAPLDRGATIFEDWGWPVIAKHERGYQGKSVRKFESWEEEKKWVEKINEKNLGMFLWQRYLPLKWDLRIIVIGGRVVGAMKRSACGDEFRSNYSLGGKVEKWELSEEEAVLAERVAKVCRLDYCGVDVMKDEAGNNYVLEVNRQCQFAGFEKATGINVAGLVVDMIGKKL